MATTSGKYRGFGECRRCPGNAHEDQVHFDSPTNAPDLAGGPDQYVHLERQNTDRFGTLVGTAG
jgi:hypothetical protein